jgi:2-polyprenyl-6-methoxyphenol hydroxylase-like FAD-dependent oxidoreductase
MNTQILVLGAGLVGLTLAFALRRQRLAVRIELAGPHERHGGRGRVGPALD